MLATARTTHYAASLITIGVAREGPQGAYPPIEMLPIIKMSQKILLFL